MKLALSSKSSLTVLSSLLICQAAWASPPSAKTNQPATQKISQAEPAGLNTLEKAVLANQLETVKTLLSKGAAVNAQNETGQTALYLAVSNQHLPIVELLLAQKADVKIPDNLGNTPLHLAVRLKSPALVSRLLAKGADPQFLNQDSVSALDLASQNKALQTLPLLLAQLKDPLIKKQALSHSLIHVASLGQIDMVKYLISIGADPKLADSERRTALMGAAQSGQLALVRMMLAYGLSSETPDAEGSTSLMYAARGGNLEVFSELLLKGGDLGEKTQRGDTLLMTAAAWNRTELVNYLLERRLNLNARNQQGQTALMLASDASRVYPYMLQLEDSPNPLKQADFVSRQAGLVNYLLSQGADPAIKDQDGLTVFHYATRGFDNPQHCDYPAPIAEVLASQDLKAKKVDLDATDLQGRTVLMLAVYAKGSGLLKSLLEQGANPNLQDKAGNYALLNLVLHPCAASNPVRQIDPDFQDKLQLLLAHKADPSLKNLAGQSALSVASKHFPVQP